MFYQFLDQLKLTVWPQASVFQNFANNWPFLAILMNYLLSTQNVNFARNKKWGFLMGFSNTVPRSAFLLFWFRSSTRLFSGSSSVLLVIDVVLPLETKNTSVAKNTKIIILVILFSHHESDWMTEGKIKVAFVPFCEHFKGMMPMVTVVMMCEHTLQCIPTVFTQLKSDDT